MQTVNLKLGQTYLFRLPPGEDLLVGLYRVCREQNVACGMFKVQGAVRSATLGHLDQENAGILRQTLDCGHDLVECSGNITPAGDRFHIQAYAILSNSQGQVTAGELLEAEVYVAEVFIQELRGRAPSRSQDPETGLWLWPII